MKNNMTISNPQNEKDSNDYYYIAIRRPDGGVEVINIGSDLDSEQIEQMTDEDVVSLYKLYKMEVLYQLNTHLDRLVD